MQTPCATVRSDGKQVHARGLSPLRATASGFGMAPGQIKEPRRLQTKANFNKLWIHHQNALYTHSHKISQFHLYDLLQCIACFSVFINSGEGGLILIMCIPQCADPMCRHFKPHLTILKTPFYVFFFFQKHKSGTMPCFVLCFTAASERNSAVQSI